MRQILDRIQGWWAEQADRFFGSEWQRRSPWGRAAASLGAAVVLTVRQVMRDRSPMMAAGLAFFTVLAVVPLLTVAASLMAAFGILDDQGGQLFDTLYRLFPDVAAGVAGYLGEVATDSAQAVGGIGAITLVIIGLVLFNYIEETFTQIWRGTRQRSLVLKLLTFWATVSFGPVLIAMSVVQTARAQLFLAEMGLDASFLGRIAPLLYALAAFTLLIKLVPDADVKWRAALAGGLFTAVAFELAKWGFNLYVNQLLMQTYDRVYGTLALIPIGLIWVYITWFVILIGAELSYSVQHMRQLLRADAGRRSALAKGKGLRTTHPMAPLEVLGVVLQHHHAGQGPVTQSTVVEQVRLPAAVVEAILEFLEQQGTLSKIEREESRRYLPAMPAEHVELEELVARFWDSQSWGGERWCRPIAEGYREASLQFFSDYTGRALVDGADRVSQRSRPRDDGDVDREDDTEKLSQKGEPAVVDS